MFGSFKNIDNTAVFHIHEKRPSSNSLQDYKMVLQRVKDSNHSGLILDYSGVVKMSFSAIAALVEFSTLIPDAVTFAIVGLKKTNQKRLRNLGLDEVLPIYPTLNFALSCQRFKAKSLSHVTAVVLCAGVGSRMQPMTKMFPKPMLPFLGKPVLGHILEHLNRFGVKNVILNPGHLAPSIHHHFGNGANSGQSIFYTNEGSYAGKAWFANPLGSASTLKKLATEHSACEDDIIVLCGDALIDIDLAHMLEHHRTTQADVTIAAKSVDRSKVHKYGIMELTQTGRVLTFQEKPNADQAKSNLANSGIYIFSPTALSYLPDGSDLDIGCDFLPRILASNGHIQVFESDFSWIDIGCGQDYANGLAMGLSGTIPNLTIRDQQIKENLWVHETAKVSAFAKIEGPVYIGPNTQIDAGAKIVGPCSLGAECHLERGSLIRNSHLFDQVTVTRGTIVQDMIVSADWAINHKFADGSIQNMSQLDGIRSTVQRDLNVMKQTA